MTYEEEQIKYAEELKQIAGELRYLDELFAQPSLVDVKIQKLYEHIYPLDFKYQFMPGIDIQRKLYRFRQSLEKDYRKKKLRKRELERLLSQSLVERNKENIKKNIGKAAEYMVSITPQHVSGRIYKVENGDGCATFCCWFMLIDAIIVFIYFLISGAF